MDSFDAGFDGTQRPPEFDRREQTRIERFLGGDAPRQVDVNDLLRARFRPRNCLGLQFEQVAEGQTDTAN